MPSAYRRKGRKYFHLEFKDQYGVTRKNVLAPQVNDKATARQLAHKIERDAARIRYGEPPLEPDVTGPFLGLFMGGRTWEEFREEYRARILAGLSAHTQEHAEDSLGHFERICQPRAVAEITTETVDRFIAARRGERGKNRGSTLSPASINKDLRHLKAALL